MTDEKNSQKIVMCIIGGSYDLCNDTTGSKCVKHD